MRNLSLAAFAVALTFLVASILFIAASNYPSDVSSQPCSIGVSLCARQRLLLVPAVASLAWAWMLRLHTHNPHPGLCGVRTSNLRSRASSGINPQRRYQA
jgi:hypothetical protein